MKKNKLLKYFFLLLLFLFFTTPYFVFALELNYPRVPGAIPPQDFVNMVPSERIIPLYVAYLVNLAIWISGLVALASLVYAGLLYLTAFGNPEKILSARQQISSAFIGMLILLSSYIIFQMLNPQLAILKEIKLKEIKKVERPEIKAGEKLVSSIDAELPLGRIIEGRIFEDYLPPNSTSTPRLTRIKKNATTTLELSNQLTDNSQRLRDLVQQCECPYTYCSGCSRCTCDPCKPVRSAIEQTEDENIKLLEKMKSEQATTSQEIKDLKFELEKLKRLEIYFVKDCRPTEMRSLKEFLVNRQYLLGKGGFLREIKFWNEINTIFWNRLRKDWIRDFSTFFCQVGGRNLERTIEEPLAPPKYPPDIGDLKPELYTQKEQIKIKSCHTNVPVGDLIERAKRTAELLIKRMDKLHSLQGEMIKAIDEMHWRISQCSSTRCIPHCTTHGCVCIGNPCPYQKIEEQLQKIKNLQKEIDDVVNKKLNENASVNEKEKAGIIPLINKVVAKILEDMETEIRYPMSECVVKQKEKGDRLLLNLEIVIGATDAQGIMIRSACYQEKVFQECLAQCYLEIGEKKYRECLRKCLDQKAQDYGLEIIAFCRHLLNYFCCNIEGQTK